MSDERIIQLENRLLALERKVSLDVPEERTFNIKNISLKLRELDELPSSCAKGEICFKAGKLYVCESKDSWVVK